MISWTHGASNIVVADGFVMSIVKAGKILAKGI